MTVTHYLSPPPPCAQRTTPPWAYCSCSRVGGWWRTTWLRRAPCRYVSCKTVLVTVQCHGARAPARGLPTAEPTGRSRLSCPSTEPAGPTWPLSPRQLSPALQQRAPLTAMEAPLVPVRRCGVPLLRPPPWRVMLDARYPDRRKARMAAQTGCDTMPPRSGCATLNSITCEGSRASALVWPHSAGLRSRSRGPSFLYGSTSRRTCVMHLRRPHGAAAAALSLHGLLRVAEEAEAAEEEGGEGEAVRPGVPCSTPAIMLECLNAEEPKSPSQQAEAAAEAAAWRRCVLAAGSPPQAPGQDATWALVTATGAAAACFVQGCRGARH
jgi:hypothetical protein